jgi:hypothetical protein
MTVRSEMARLGSGDVGLSVILAIQISIVFIVAPLAATDTVTIQLAEMLRFGLAATMILIVARNWIVRAVVGFAFIATLVASLHWQLGGTADAIVLGKIAVTILFDAIVAAVVAHATFAPGKVTIHRILGAVILYLYVALIFAGVYRLMAVTLYPAFRGLPVGQRGQFSGLLYYSLSALTTAGSGDIVAQHPLVRSLSSLEAVIGQLYPATLLARLVSLHGSEQSGVGKVAPDGDQELSMQDDASRKDSRRHDQTRNFDDRADASLGGEGAGRQLHAAPVVGARRSPSFSDDERR